MDLNAYALLNDSDSEDDQEADEEILDETVPPLTVDQVMIEQDQQVIAADNGKSVKKSYHDMFSLLIMPDYDMLQRDFEQEVGALTPSPTATPNPNAITHRLE